MATKIKLTDEQMRQGVFVLPLNKDCEMSGEYRNGVSACGPVDPRQTIRAGSKHYHFCKVHGKNR